MLHIDLTLSMCQENDYLDMIGTIIEIDRHHNLVKIEVHESGTILEVPRFDSLLEELGYDQPRYRVVRPQNKFRPARGNSVLSPSFWNVGRNHLAGEPDRDKFFTDFLKSAK